MGMSDCPECWDTPCTCKRGYLGSKNYAYDQLKKEITELKEQLVEKDKSIREFRDTAQKFADELNVKDARIAELEREKSVWTKASENVWRERDRLRSALDRVRHHVVGFKANGEILSEIEQALGKGE